MEHATATVERWLGEFSAALGRADGARVAALFEPDGLWRDLVAFTWNIVTLDGRDEIAALVDDVAARVGAHGFRIDGEATITDGVAEAWLVFETAVARGRGHVRLRDGLAFTLLTTMTELIGHEERRGPTRERGVEHGVVPGRRTWLERRRDEAARLGRSDQPYCVIVGGGQGGIALGARLRRLGVPSLIVERNERPGDSWRRRYRSLCLHDPVWYDHLPYLPFPDHWPVFSPKDQIADWLEMYVSVMEIPYWASTECLAAAYDDAAATWRVTVRREGEELELRPRQLVLATGMSGLPNVPAIPGAERFTGDQHHSSQHPGGEEYHGRRCVVIGSNNSAHDIAADLWEHGALVTMVQRSTTHVARSETLLELALGDLYSERALANGIDHDTADLIFASLPYRILADLQRPVYDEVRRRDADLYRRLEAAGFLLDFGDDDSGLFMKYLRRGSGYYIDVGASELVADGRIALRSGVEVAEIRETSVVLSDGDELAADLIVYATGYGSMNGFAAQLISQEVADRVGKVWGLGSATRKDPGPWEGELRNMWKPTRQEALWFHGGNLHQSRHYSQFLALQLAARHAGIPTPVHRLAPVHHTS